VIDWYMLLAPLVVLPIILLFVFVGCPATEPAVDPYYDLFPPSLRLRFDITKSTPEIMGITAIFTLLPSGGVSHSFPPINSGPLKWSPDASGIDHALGTLETPQFDTTGEPFTCTCRVDVDVDPPIPPFGPEPAPETTHTVTFRFEADPNTNTFSLGVET
jgi:hypothetical protein